MGIHSPAYRDLNLSFVNYKSTPYHLTGIFNRFYCDEANDGPDREPLGMGETFSGAIAYLGTYLHRKGFSYDYINCLQDEEEQLVQKLERENIRLIAVTTTLYVSPVPIIEIIRFIRKHNRTAKIVVGGPFVATQVRSQEHSVLEYLFQSMDADYYVYSAQGEAALVKLLETLKNNGPLDEVPNLYYKTKDGYCVTRIIREDNPLSENMVNWELFSSRVERHVGVRTSISCPFSCAFCSFPGHAGKHQAVSVDELEQELNALNRIPSVKSVNFIDDTFNIPVKRFKEILRMMIRNNYRFGWNAHFRCQFADEETVLLMKESKCEGVFLGLESGNNAILQNMNKKATVEKFLEGIALLKKHDILTFASFIVGFPGETPDTVQDSIRLIEQSRIDYYRAQLWYCDTLTPIWQEREKYNLSGAHFEWRHDTMDSRTASDLVDHMFLTVENSTWVPQYGFDLDHLFQMVHRGFTLEQVRKILDLFNRGVREKLVHRSPGKEVNPAVVNEMKTIIQGSETAGPVNLDQQSQYNVEFNF